MGSWAALLALILTAQGGLSDLPSKELVDSRAKALGTTGPSDRAAHLLLERPLQRFPYPTLIFALEKTSQGHLRPQALKGEFRSPEEEALIARLESPCDCQAPARPTPCERTCQMVEQQTRKLNGYLDEGSRSFVSHILFYGQPCPTTPEVVYSAYADCTLETGKGYDCDASAYDNSWSSLARLESFLQEQVDKQDFTHILLLSMGWNTTQVRSVAAFEEISGFLAEEAAASGVPFRPLIVGLTWHSGWHWGLDGVPYLKFLPTVVSYGNKAKDADEIGLTWANALLNRVLLPLGAANDLPVAAIGHSFGARLLTRAAASAHLLEAELTEPLSLLVSLQGAFSINRFLSERCAGKEGAPYFDLSGKVERVVLVWSRGDGTNPLANLLSGANHAGGKPAYSRAIKYRHRFEFATWEGADRRLLPANPKSREPGSICGGAASDLPPIEIIEATSSVSKHGDVRNRKVGALIWHLLQDL